MPHEPIDWMMELTGLMLWLRVIALFVVFWLVEEWAKDDELTSGDTDE